MVHGPLYQWYQQALGLPQSSDPIIRQTSTLGLQDDSINYEKFAELHYEIHRITDTEDHAACKGFPLSTWYS